VGLDAAWHGRELWAPAFAVDVVGTTGAGDAAIAGFLSSLVRGADPQTALMMGTAAGACSVSQADPVSGLVPWAVLWDRVQAGWESLPLDLSDFGWQKDSTYGIWQNP